MGKTGPGQVVPADPGFPWPGISALLGFFRGGERERGFFRQRGGSSSWFSPCAKVEFSLWFFVSDFSLFAPVFYFSFSAFFRFSPFFLVDTFFSHEMYIFLYIRNISLYTFNILKYIF